jgi:hypothetical protein
MTSLANEVEKVVVEMTRNRRIFTAHDITKLLRHRLDGENIRHNDVKKEVHSLYDNDDMGIYMRTQVNMGTRVAPFVYHLSHQDPNQDYSKDWVQTMIDLANNVSINPIDGSTISNDDDDDDTISLTPPVPTSVTGSIKGVKPLKRVGSAPQPVTSMPTMGVIANLKVTNALRDVASSKNDGFYTRTVTSEGRLTVPINMIKGSFLNEVYVTVGSALKSGKTVDALVLSTDKTNAIKTYNINADGRLRISSKFLNKIGSSSTYSVKEANGSVVIIAE